MQQPIGEHGHQRDGEDADGRGDQNRLGEGRRRNTLDQTGPEDDKGELACGSQNQRRLDGGAVVQAPQPGHAEDQPGLQQGQQGGKAEDPDGIGGDSVEIETDPDPDKKHTQQQPLERLDRNLDLPAELGLGQQEAGDQGSQAHRQAGGLGRHPRADDHQQAGGDEHLLPLPLGLGSRDRSEHRSQDQPAQHDQQRQADGGRDQCEQGRQQRRRIKITTAGTVLGQCRQNRDGDQDRRHSQILGQKDGEGGASGRRLDPAPLGHHRHDNGGRRQGQAHPQNSRRDQRLPHEHKHRRQRHGTGRDLGQAEAEHQFPHGPEPLPRQFQPDHEQQEGDAELGQGPDLGGIRNGQPGQPGGCVGQARQTVRAQQYARREEAEDRADLQAIEQRHDHAGRGQKDHQILVFAAVAVNRHSSSAGVSLQAETPSRRAFHPG